MAMNPRTHPRGAAPDFALPRANPNPDRMTDALWWLVCMRELLEPSSQNGGTYANKAGYHNAGNNLPADDHSIRRPPDRSGPWWRTKTSAHDWTFPDAQSGRYVTIQRYTRRLVNAMRDPGDLRPDDVYAYTLGQTDGDPIVEGYNEYTDDPETSADKTHLWHRHDSFRRNIIGNPWAMWAALTIDMGWTYAEWLRSTESPGRGDMATLDATDLTNIRNTVWQAKPWSSANPISTADALQQASLADNALAAVTSLTDLVMQQSGQSAEDIAAALAPLILAGLPDSDLSQDDVETAVRNVLRAGTDADAS